MFQTIRKNKCAIITWIIVTLIISSFLFIILYMGRTFGYVKSLVWTTTVIISTAQKIMVLDPLFLSVKSIFYTILRRHPPDYGYKVELPEEAVKITFTKKGQPTLEEMQYYSTNMVEQYRNGTFELPDEEDKEEMREKQEDIAEIKKMISDFTMFALYLFFLSMLVLGTREPLGYYSSKTAKDYFVTSYFANVPLDSVIDRATLKEYLNQTVLPGLHDGKSNSVAAIPYPSLIGIHFNRNNAESGE